MNMQLIAGLILLPFIVVFVYAGVHEYRRYKSAGRASYGLAFDEKTGTSFVAEVSAEDEPFDPEDFDPNDYSDPEIREDRQAGKS